MEPSFSEIIQGILERNPALGLQRHGESGMISIVQDREVGAPRLLACTLVGKPRPAKTVGHGPGLAIELKLVVTGAGAGERASAVRSFAIGPMEPSGRISLLTATGLGWAQARLDEEMIEESRRGKIALRLKGLVPFAFLAGGDQARFQVHLTNTLGNTSIELVSIPIANAGQMLRRFPRERNDGDDPRDLPPPTIFGEEIDRDEALGLVYVVSDFHLGSSRGGRHASNDMDAQTLERFLRFLEACERDARDHPHYDVVMNGDFLDLWQARRSSNDTYGGRLEDIIETNASFFGALGSFLRRTPKCRFHYVIGNHDDPLLSMSSPDDPAFGPSDSFGSLRDAVSNVVHSVHEAHLLPHEGWARRWRRDSAPLSFAMIEEYTNPQFQMLALHGHQFDEANRRDDDGEPSDGQGIADQVNQMQESSERFRSIEYVPMHETAKHLRCMLRSSRTTDAERDAIEELKDRIVASVDSSVLDVFAPDSVVANRIVELTRPEVVRDTARGAAQQLQNDPARRPPVRILVTGHTHLEELVPRSGETDRAYANTGSWFRRVRAGQNSTGCVLTVSPSKLPYVRVSRERDANRALVELLYFSGDPPVGLVRVDLES